MRLEDKVAIITGAGSGIGRATALLFAEEGAKVAVADCNAEAGQTTVELIGKLRGEACFVQADVSKADQVQYMVQVVANTYGRIDVLFNNAGVFFRGSVTETEEEDWDRILDVNLKSMYLCSKSAIPYMIAGGGGSIVNTSSITGAHHAVARAAAYVASKGGVTLLTRCMAIDYADHGIRVNCVCPGMTDTAMVRARRTAQELQALASTLIMKRLGNPREVAQVVLFLASDESLFVNGVAIAVDGGQTTMISVPGA